MDKDTISNYGWIIVTVLVGVIMLAMATPLGNYIFANVQHSTLEGIKNTNLGKPDKNTIVAESAERKDLIFETKGGKFTGGYMTSYQPGTVVHLPTNVEKENYEFGGWYTTPNCTGEMVTKTNASDRTNLVYYAKWIGEKFVIAYNLNGGIFQDPTNVPYSYTYKEQIHLPTGSDYGIVTKDGKVFDGWYNATTNTRVTNNDIVSGNLTLYAKWK